MSAARTKRRNDVIGATRELLDRLDKAGAIANENIVLHAVAARKVIKSVNRTASLIEDLYAPLAIESGRDPLEKVSYRVAIRDRDQLLNAGKEVGEKAAVAGGVALGVAAIAIGNQKRTSR